MSITSEAPQRIAFLFPGQGTPPAEIQTFCTYLKGIDGRLFTKRVQIAEEQYEQVATELGEPVPFNLAAELEREDSSPSFTRTDFTQMAMGVIDSIAVDMVLEKAQRPLLAAGHSYGEVVGGYMVGIIPRVEDLMRFSAARGIIMQRYCKDTALYIVKGLSVDQVEEVVRATSTQKGLLNAPKLFLIGGKRGREEEIQAAAQRIDTSATVSQFEYAAGAFHTDYFKDAQTELRDFISRDVEIGRITVQDAPDDNLLAMNLSGSLTRKGIEFLENHFTSMTTYVDWVASLRNLQEAGASTFVVAGPSRTLQGINILNGLGRSTKDITNL